MPAQVSSSLSSAVRLLVVLFISSAVGVLAHRAAAGHATPTTSGCPWACMQTPLLVLVATIALCVAVRRLFLGGKRPQKDFAMTQEEEARLAALNAFLKEHRHRFNDDDCESTLQLLRELLQKRIIRPRDSVDSPRLLFAIHCAMVDYGLHCAGTRITVHLNLFSGFLYTFGHAAHIAAFESLAQGATPAIGAFALTEKETGVTSGLNCNTIAKMSEDGQTFSVDTVDENQAKTWISQGVYADCMVLFARVKSHAGKDLGVHAFFVNVKEHKQSIEVETIKKQSMVGLDNATLRFRGLKLPRSALMDKVYPLDAIQKGEIKYTFMMIADRLLSGRLCLSYFAVTGLRNALKELADFTDNKHVYVGSERVLLAKLHHVQELRKDTETALKSMEALLRSASADYIDLAAASASASSSQRRRVVRVIADSKIVCTRVTMHLLYRMRLLFTTQTFKKESSVARMYDDILCAYAAEGESFILTIKNAGDSLKDVQRNKTGFLAKALWSLLSLDSYALSVLRLQCRVLGRSLTNSLLGTYLQSTTDLHNLGLLLALDSLRAPRCAKGKFFRWLMY